MCQNEQNKLQNMLCMRQAKLQLIMQEIGPVKQNTMHEIAIVFLSIRLV